MLGLLNRKIIRDIWDSKARTFLVVITIAISIFSIGSMGRVWFIMSSNLRNTYLDANPASATLVTAAPFDESLERRVARMADVGDVEAVNVVGGRIQAGPNRWRSLRLIVPSDYDELMQYIEEKKMVRVNWCGSEDCEATIKEETGASSCCIPFGEEPDGSCIYCGKDAHHVVYFAKHY